HLDSIRPRAALSAVEEEALGQLARLRAAIAPQAHWPKLRSTNPLERVNREIGRRSDVAGIFPNDASALRLAGALLIEQCDEWLVARRYLSVESLALVLEDQGDEEPKEVAELQPA
ncbi:MAG TPA: transposase, partial [Solirubrobacterales bacterium]